MCKTSFPRIEVRDLVKVYKLYSSPFKKVLDQLTHGRFGLHTPFRALDGITFSLSAGESFGLIGPNGGGKSTLLRILAGISPATGGSVYINGEVGSLLELGMGFHPEFTGRENLRLCASMLGIPESEIPSAVERMIDFAEIGDFIDQPVRTYSSGMFLRLAFSFAVETDPDVLLVDEVLAVGDIYFRNKSFRRMLEMRDRGKLMVVASHDPGVIRRLCDRVLWLDRGRVRFLGPVKEGLDAYEEDVRRLTEKRLSGGGNKSRVRGDFVFRAAGKVCGTGEMRILDVALFDDTGRRTWVIETGKSAAVEMTVYAARPVERAAFGVFIHASDGALVALSHNSEEAVVWGRPFEGFSKVRVELPPLHLVEGTYFMSVGTSAHGYDGTLDNVLDYHDQMYELVVTGSHLHRYGFFRVPGNWSRKDAAGMGAQELLPLLVSMDRESDRRFLTGLWYERETDAGGGFCWMAGEGGVILRKHEGVERFFVDIRTDSPEPVELDVQIGNFTKRVKVPAGPWRRVEFMPKGVDDGVVEVRLKALNVWRPCDACLGDDARELSVAVRRVGFE